jgi:glycosyltransferase involved in cell wall biosynthesis
VEKGFKMRNLNDYVLRLLVIINGWAIKTMTGGDYHILRVLRNWSKEHHISLIMPKLGYTATTSMLSNKCSIYFTSGEEKIDGSATIIISYLIRIMRSLFLRFDHHPDVIIASSHLLYDVFPAMFLRRRLKSKLVVYVHHILGSFRTQRDGIWSRISLLNERISLSMCKTADLIFVVNSDVRDALIDNGFRADKIFMTGNGVEHQLIDSVKVNTKRFDACFCGRLVKAKGVYDLLEVWERVLKDFPKSRLLIIGDGQEYNRLLETVKNKALDKNIILTGFLSEKLKIFAMKSCNIFISASYEEGWGIPVSEAMACELAVVCYDLSVYKVFGDAILKVEVGNKEAMAKAVICLLADENSRKTMALDAKEASKPLSWEEVSMIELKEINKM